MRILDVRGKDTGTIYKLESQYPPRFYRCLSTQTTQETTDAAIKEFQKRAEKEGAVALFISNYGQSAYIPQKEIPRMAGESAEDYQRVISEKYKLPQGIPEGKCKKCGKKYFGWALKSPEHRVCECGGEIEIVYLPQILAQTEHGRITGIIKGKEYWPKVNATQKAILDRMNAGTILEVHSDGDLTFEAEGRTYVLTTSGELFARVATGGRNGPGKLPQTITERGMDYYKVPPEAY